MIGQRLRHARKILGLSLRDLGDQVGLTHAAIKKYEDEQVTPNSTMLLKLARALKVRTEYFFRPHTVVLDSIEYRKHGNLSRKRLNVIEHEIIDQIERRIELETLFPNPPVKPFSLVRGLPACIADFDQVETAAEAVRKAWDLGSDPIPDLVDVLEAKGIRVFVLDVNADPKFDGLAASANQTPIVVVGSNWPGDRQRFTLAHELGHLMLGPRLDGTIDEESACSRFAAAFLIPRKSAVQALGSHRSSLELKELALLKEEFGLSMAGILHRARDLGIVSPKWRDEQARMFKANGWHMKEPGNSYPAEKARLFEQMVFHALAEDYIGESKAAELMSMSLTDFRALRALEGGHAAIDQ